MNYTLTLFKLLSSKIIFEKLLGIKNEAIKDRRAKKEPIKKNHFYENLVSFAYIHFDH